MISTSEHEKWATGPRGADGYQYCALGAPTGAHFHEKIIHCLAFFRLCEEIANGVRFVVSQNSSPFEPTCITNICGRGYSPVGANTWRLERT